MTQSPDEHPAPPADVQHHVEVHVTRIVPKPEGGLVASTIRSTGETLHWLGRRFGSSGRGHVTRRVLDIWREGGHSLLRDHLLNERAAARRNIRYRQWMREVEPGLLAQVAADAGAFAAGPAFSIIVPVYNTDPAMLRACVESVIAQTYGRWTLALVDDASTRAGTREALEHLARRDDRISLIRRKEQGGISAATNDGVSVATGEFIALLDHDDELSPHALAAMAQHIIMQRGADVLYSDEDKIDERGRRHTPVFKPSLSPHHLFTSNYCCHLLVVRTQLMREVGGLRTAFNGAQDYDLVLRCLETSTRFVHVPLVLYHWRTHGQSTSGAGRAKPYAAEAGRVALREFMQRRGIDGPVAHSPFLLSYRVRSKVSADDRVEVVRTRPDGTVVEHDWSEDRSRQGSRWVLFLSQRISGISAGDVAALVEAGKLPHAGPVGGIIIGVDGRIDDAGWFVDREGTVRGRYCGCPATLPGAGWALRLPRNVSFVGPQCLLVEQSWARRVLSSAASVQPWFVALARAMRVEGRLAQIVGDVHVQCAEGDAARCIPRRVEGAFDGLLSEHLAWVEPEYAPPIDSDHDGDSGTGAGSAMEGRCAASSA